MFPRVLLVYLISVLTVASIGCYHKKSEKRAKRNKTQVATTKKPDNVFAERTQLDQSVWKDEVTAQKFEQFFTDLWDDIRSSNGFGELGKISFEELNIPNLIGTHELAREILQFEFGEKTIAHDPASWKNLLHQVEKRGFEIVECEFHHSRFTTGNQCVSEVDFIGHLRRVADVASTIEQRLIIRGVLKVIWNQPLDPQKISVHNLQMLTRTGRTAFRKMISYTRREADFASAHPILVDDLDKNGFCDIIISRWNRVYWNDGSGKFREDKFLDHWIPIAEAGMIADVTTDGHSDFIGIDNQGRPVVFSGSSKGDFASPGFVAADVKTALTFAMTGGDMDSDGDVDLWISQYKPSYENGQMPTPYYDANDGEPSFLLINDGTGQFEDQTSSRGLDRKRQRRTYSNSFVDLDHDSDLDLMVVSDYAGVDLYENNGKGFFTDVTDSWISERHLFGMAHTIADFNSDGMLDFYAIGMSSTTARRLDRLNAIRVDRPEIHKMRSAMGYGNRIYLGQAIQSKRSRFRKPEYAANTARTGWSWGTTSFDFDLDGDRDIYVANGFRSGESCQDYCTTYWRHDLYTGDSNENENLETIFRDSMKDLQRGLISWNGYEHNALLMNLDGMDFINVAFLFGLSFEYDARAVIGNDLDNDGRTDLIISEYRYVRGGYEMDLHVYRNELITDNHWIGVQIENLPASDVLGSKVFLHTNDGIQAATIVTGDSFLSQHAPQVVFGLGKHLKPQQIIVRLPNGQELKNDDPAMDSYWIIR